MEKFYNRYWKNKEVLEDFYYKWPHLKKFIPREKGIKILDFGCGKGKILSEIIKVNPYLNVAGVDVSTEALEIIRKKFKKYKFYQIKDGEKLPFKTNSFDFIIASDVLEHVYDTENVFFELARVLKPKGKILITVPYHGLIKNLIIFLFFFEFIFDPQGPHIRFFTKKSLLRCLSKVKLIPLKIEHFGRFYPLSKGMLVLAQKT